MLKILKIATFNLLNYLEPPNAYYEFENIYTKEQWRIKQGWIVEKLRQIDADIIGFQEVFSLASLQALLEKCGYPYFACVDMPDIENGYLYTEPPLAIASRFPIRSVHEVKPDTLLLMQHPTPEPFCFSRKPIHVTIDVEGFGIVNIINVHLKSQRPVIQDGFSPEEKITKMECSARKFGRWLSTVQRGFECHYLYHYICRIRQNNGYPVVLLGDFNQSVNSLPCTVLLSPEKQEVNGEAIEQPILYDAWQLYCGKYGRDKDFLQWSRAPTHYFGAFGNVLDYILMSAEFDAENSHGCYKVEDYSVIDEHIVNVKYELDKLASDHAIVTIAISTN